MQTLYVRMIITTMFIMLVSVFIGFLITNLYYHINLKPTNDAKITEIAENVVAIYEQSDHQDIHLYLSSMSLTGYTFILFEHEHRAKIYGVPIDVQKIPDGVAQSVIDGEVYHGIRDYPYHPLVTGFFNNDITNTVGVPIQVDGKTHALFLRQDTVQQFGEMRIFLAYLLLFTVIISFVSIILSTRYLVKPIKDLSLATQKIAGGNYHVKLNVQRQDEIGRLAQDFTRMSSSLARIEEKRQEFVSSVSHEIQSPLTSIQGFSQALREEDLTKEQREHYLSIIEKESRRLSQLSSQLLTLSTLDRDDYEFTHTPFDIVAQIKEIIATLEWQWQEKALTIEVRGIVTHIVGEPQLLYQVWLNIISNAIRYTPKGGSIIINIEKDTTQINVMIRDTGIGIAEEDLHHIFERFYKIDKARTRDEESTGLGLAISQKIVELHNGTIMVESEEGKGTTFTITLPIYRDI
ncbi:MAG TPA: HAMP domain-containing sensor histidine kinase [Bacillota bacterium]|nr:HAMP domain-containing sensor histidine kinase [Bacillota bacterium]